MKYFKMKEFMCPCCGEADMDAYLLTCLDGARELAGVPFNMTSGYRCEKHNAKVGGTADSSHLKGEAVDIAVNSSRDRFVIMKGLIFAGFNRIGVGRDFIHADVDTSKTPKVMWTYYDEVK